MPKVSRNIPLPHVQAKVRKSLVEVFEVLRRAEDIKLFIFDLLTPSEITMLGKRLTAAFMLQEGYSYTTVCKFLKLSKTTVNTLHRDLERSGDGYRLAYKKVFQNQPTKLDNWISALQLPTKGSPSDMRRWKKAITSL